MGHLARMQTQPSSKIRRSYIPHIKREWGHYREISDRDFDVLTEYIKAEVLDFPVMTERKRLIGYLLYGLFSAIQEYNENTGINFPHPLARAMALLVAHTKEVSIG